MDTYFLRNLNFSDINPVDAGYEECTPGHSWGFYVRNYYLVHYVVSGKGTLFKNGKLYSVIPGQAFLIEPGESTKYTADEKEPWTYIWIGFKGELSSQLKNFEPPVFEPDGRIFEKIKECEKYTNTREIYLSGCICELLCDMLEKDTVVNPVEVIKNYIDVHYMENPRVEELARTVSLSRKYLVRIFKKHTGATIQEYIVMRKMKMARKLLLSGYNVNETAHITGYSDQSTFSRAFKAFYSVSPSQLKNEN